MTTRIFKLSRDDIRDIVALHEQGYMQQAIADRYGVAPSAINYHLAKHVVLFTHRTPSQRADLAAKRRALKGVPIPAVTRRTRTIDDGSIVVIPESGRSRAVIRLNTSFRLRYIVRDRGCHSTRHGISGCNCKLASTLAQARAIAEADS